MRLYYLILVCGISSTPAMGISRSLWSSYNLGVSYDTSKSYAAINYEAPAAMVLPDDCELVDAGSKKMQCTAYLGPSSDDSSPSTSLYLDKPFVRQGWFYFDYGLTFSTLNYKGGLVLKPKQASSPGSVSKNGQKPTLHGQPLEQAYLELYGINWQGYLRFGLTPLYIPDLLLTVGLGVQTVGGRVKILKQDEIRLLAQPEIFAEAEVVVVRMHTGSLSAFVARDSSFTGRALGKPADDYVGGSQMSNFKLVLSSASAGINLLFPF